MKRRYWVTALAAVLVGAFLFPATALAKQPKVDVCHFDKDTGTYKLINIPQKAADKHIAKHGDVYANTEGLDENCDPVPLGTAEVDLVKEVSVDGGVTFWDANEEESAPGTDVGRGVLYRLMVTNPGTVDLANVVIYDPTLGVVDFFLGDLADGVTVVLTEDDIPELAQSCQAEGVVFNTAAVDAESVATGEPVSDSDPAVVRCFVVDG